MHAGRGAAEAAPPIYMSAMSTTSATVTTVAFAAGFTTTTPFPFPAASASTDSASVDTSVVTAAASTAKINATASFSALDCAATNAASSNIMSTTQGTSANVTEDHIACTAPFHSSIATNVVTNTAEAHTAATSDAKAAADAAAAAKPDASYNYGACTTGEVLAIHAHDAGSQDSNCALHSTISGNPAAFRLRVTERAAPDPDLHVRVGFNRATGASRCVNRAELCDTSMKLRFAIANAMDNVRLWTTIHMADAVEFVSRHVNAHGRCGSFAVECAQHILQVEGSRTEYGNLTYSAYSSFVHAAAEAVRTRRRRPRNALDGPPSLAVPGSKDVVDLGHGDLGPFELRILTVLLAAGPKLLDFMAFGIELRVQSVPTWTALEMCAPALVCEFAKPAHCRENPVVCVASDSQHYKNIELVRGPLRVSGDCSVAADPTFLQEPCALLLSPFLLAFVCFVCWISSAVWQSF